MIALKRAIMCDMGGGYYGLVHTSLIAPGSRLRWSYEHDQWMLVLDRW